MLWVLVCKVHLTVCYYNVTYAFQSGSTLCRCLKFKEPLARNRRDIWNLSDCNVIRTDNHLVRKRTLNHQVKLAKWLSCVVSTWLYGAFDFMLLPCHVRVLCFVCELRDCGFESHCCHLNVGYRACFKQSKTQNWHDSNIRWNAPYRQVLTTQLDHLASSVKCLSNCLRTKIVCTDPVAVN